MEDRALSLRGRHFHGGFVIQSTAVVINNATLYGNKYHLVCPYRAMVPVVSCMVTRTYYTNNY